MIDLQRLNCDKNQLVQWQNNGLDVKLIDLREFYEDPPFPEADINVSLDRILSYEFEANANYVLFCQTGVRAKAAAIEVFKKYPEKKVYYYIGGLESYKD